MGGPYLYGAFRPLLLKSFLIVIGQSELIGRLQVQLWVSLCWHYLEGVDSGVASPPLDVLREAGTPAAFSEQAWSSECFVSVNILLS